MERFHKIVQETLVTQKEMDMPKQAVQDIVIHLLERHLKRFDVCESEEDFNEQIDYNPGNIEGYLFHDECGDR